LILTIRSRFFSLNCWSILNQLAQSPRRTQRKGFGSKNVVTVVPSVRGQLVQAIFIKSVVAFPAAIVDFAQTIRQRLVLWPIPLERCRSCHFVVPIFRPDTVGLAQAGRP